ncbi:hypothetical protein LCGC14_1046850, partial [marine sediment metagenome]
MKLYYDTGNSGTYPQDGTEPSWTRIGDIISFPKIKSRMDETGICIVKLRDYEGNLFDFWKTREWTRMKLEDEDSNVIFLGYLTGKSYTEKDMTMTISGISKVFQWFPIDKNYVLAEGYIDDIAFGADTTRLDLVQGNEARDNFAWIVDKWITDRDVAILIRDNSTGNTQETWLVTGISQFGGENIFADAGWADDPDGIYYRIREINETTFNCVVTPTLGGDNIPNTNTISKIEIFYDFKITWLDFVMGSINLEVNRGGAWQRIVGAYGGHQWWGSTSKRLEGSFELIGDDLTDYLVLDGANWDEMLGIRFKFNGDYQALDGTQSLFIDYIKIVITYNADDISPIMETLTNNGASFIKVAGVNWEEMGITDGGADDGDIFKIGENCKQIIEDIGVACHIDILQLTASTKYISQHFKGNYGIQLLKKVCLLEGWHYWEDYTDGVFGSVHVGHLDDLVDSGVDITQADYDHDWLYEGDPNYFSKVIVYGSAAHRIQQSATSESVESPKTKVFYEETITTNAEALDIAIVQLAEWSVKHPSIKLILKGVQANIKVGTEITLTMVRPTVAEANYPVRMIERERLGHSDIKTTVYAGMGHSSIDEKLANRINKIMYLAQKSHADRLITTPPGVGVTGIAWGDIADATAGVEAIITAELVDGQSINNAIDALIAAITFGDVDSGTDFNSHSEQIKAGFIIHGGGSITVDGSDRVGWTQRMIVIDGGHGAHFSTGGYFDINQPTSGAITAVGSGTANTWTAAGIIIPAWQSLYYILPIGSTNTSLAANFRMVGYQSALEIPDDWIFIAGHNGDTHITKFGVGIQLNASETWVQGTASMIKYTNAEAVTAVINADDYLKNDDDDETTGDLTVANLITAGLVDGVDVSVRDHAKYTDAEALAYVNAQGLALANTKV